jgi:hypothetical protein
MAPGWSKYWKNSPTFKKVAKNSCQAKKMVACYLVELRDCQINSTARLCQPVAYQGARKLTGDNPKLVWAEFSTIS